MKFAYRGFLLLFLHQFLSKSCCTCIFLCPNNNRTGENFLVGSSWSIAGEKFVFMCHGGVFSRQKISLEQGFNCNFSINSLAIPVAPAYSFVLIVTMHGTTVAFGISQLFVGEKFVFMSDGRNRLKRYRCGRIPKATTRHV